MERREFSRGGSIFKVYRCVVMYRRERMKEEVRRQEKKHELLLELSLSDSDV